MADRRVIATFLAGVGLTTATLSGCGGDDVDSASGMSTMHSAQPSGPPVSTPTEPTSGTPSPSPPTVPPTTPPATTPPATAPDAESGSDPWQSTTGLYVDVESQPAAWAQANPDDPRSAAIAEGIAQVPMGHWFNGDAADATDARAYVGAAQAMGELAQLVLYNVPLRGCGDEGAADAEAYALWVDGLVAAVGTAPALVVLEPDAVAQADCLSEDQRAERYATVASAVAAFAAGAPSAWVYVDAGHSGWVEPAEVAARLQASGVENARGFALNVSNYQATEWNLGYAAEVNAELGAFGVTPRGFVVDTSRNGRPSDGSDWCNPPGQLVGRQPSAAMDGGFDAELWVKIPGESDGDCGIGEGSEPGAFLPDVAVELLGG